MLPIRGSGGRGKSVKVEFDDMKYTDENTLSQVNIEKGGCLSTQIEARNKEQGQVGDDYNYIGRARKQLLYKCRMFGSLFLEQLPESIKIPVLFHFHYNHTKIRPFMPLAKEKFDENNNFLVNLRP